MTLDELKQKARERAGGGWVMLPEPAPKMLPAGTRLRTRHGFLWELDGPHALSDEWGNRNRSAYLGVHRNLGTTGACPSGALCEASDIEGVLLPPGYHFEGSEVVKEEAEPNYCHNRHGAYTQLCDESCREAHGQFQYGTCPECAGQRWNPSLDRCDHCGVTGKEIAAKRAKPACKCGATSNLAKVGVSVANGRVSQAWRCGPCEQSRRRAELQAQKLEQTKRDMSRPVRRDPYEWLGFSSADWEE